MKKLFFSLLAFAAVFILIKCESDSGNNLEIDRISDIAFVKTVSGGCNTLGENSLKSTSVDTDDSMSFTIDGDTLKLSIGLNYLCCAPFETETTVAQDTIVVAISDTCTDEGQACHCRCTCFYTWDFSFVDFLKKEYTYKILLNDLSEDAPIVLWEGKTDLSKIN